MPVFPFKFRFRHAISQPAGAFDRPAGLLTSLPPTPTSASAPPQVSWGDGAYKNATAGTCATWEVVKTCEAEYQTRMRIYKSKGDPQLYAVAFRPTQQTPEVRGVGLVGFACGFVCSLGGGR